MLAAAQSPAATYLAKNNAKFKQMLNTVGVDDKALNAMHGVLLAPSDDAVDALASGMGMTLPEMLRNKQLVDQVTAYHFLPGIKVTPGLKVPSMPLTTKTGNQHQPGGWVGQHCSGSRWICYVWHAVCPSQFFAHAGSNQTSIPLPCVCCS